MKFIRRVTDKLLRIIFRSAASAAPAFAQVLHPAVDRGRILLREDLFFHKYRRTRAYGDRDGVARPGIDMKFLVIVEQIERGVEGALDQVADDHTGDLDLEAVEDAGDKVMGERPGGIYVAHGKGCGVALGGPHRKRGG